MNVKECLRKIRDLNSRMQRLLTNSVSSGRLSSGNPAGSPKTLRQIATQATELHDAIFQGLSCDCIEGHEAYLGLYLPKYVNTSQPFEILIPMDEHSGKKYAALDRMSLASYRSSSVESDFDARRYLDPASFAIVLRLTE